MVKRIDFEALLRTDLLAFIERAFYEISPQTILLLAPYIELMVAYLEACRQGKIKRLIINVPPRHLKSHSVSIAFVAWLLGHKPATEIICVSYAQELADKLALDCRRVMSSPWYKRLFDTRLAANKKAVNHFLTTMGGNRVSTSVEGVLTGFGADWIIIDDPLKPEDAFSEVKRKKVNEWYDRSLVSRLNDKKNGVIIIIMQRLHQDDLVGHVLGQEEWTRLTFPAIAEEDEVYPIDLPSYPRRWFRRQVGEPLHAERESLALLKDMRNRIGDYNFSSQYQQNPIPIGGAIIKTDWLQYYDSLPERSEVSYLLQSWDTAVKTDELNDFSVCTTWAIIHGNYYLIHVHRKRLNFPDLKRAVLWLAQEFNPNTILIEDKSSGSSLIQDLKAEGEYRVKPYEPAHKMDKVMRLHAQSGLFEHGAVFLPKEAAWLSEYRTEITSFPGAKFDDQVDSTTQALDYLKTHFNRPLEVWKKLGRKN